jgi:hypothetical protein
MLCLVVLVRTEVSEELSAFIIRVTRIGELGTTLDLTSNRCTLEEIQSHLAFPIVPAVKTSNLTWSVFVPREYLVRIPTDLSDILTEISGNIALIAQIG